MSDFRAELQRRKAENDLVLEKMKNPAWLASFRTESIKEVYRNIYASKSSQVLENSQGGDALIMAIEGLVRAMVNE